MNEERLEKLIREIQKLHERNELSGRIGSDYFEPGMMEYLDQSDGSFDRDSGILRIKFEARGTRYDGRTEIIEKVHQGDSVLIVREKENPFNTNNFTLLTEKGKNIGNMPAELCNVIAPLYDDGCILFKHSEVSYVEPISKRNRHAKQAVLFIALEARFASAEEQVAAAAEKSSVGAPDEAYLISVLKQKYPDGIVFQERYNPKILGAAVHYGIYKLAKTSGVSVSQWLEANGFHWRETGYVEADMRTLSGREIVAADAVELSDSILRKYPLVGQYEPGENEFNMLFSAGVDCVRKICRPGTTLTKREELVLTVATVQVLKKRNIDAQDASQDETLWSYIYQQFGFNPDNSDSAKQKVYKSFCTAIKNTLEAYHRFLAPANTMRYYTSLMMHAIAPKTSIESLFDILFDFYVKNLDFQYVSEDTSYKTFVKGMRARWTNTNVGVQLKSSAVMSGLKTLFLERPGYMASLCDGLTEKIDRLLRGETIEIRDRWDHLLEEWYQKKSSIERNQFQGQKRAHRTEYIATTAERIYVQYCMDRGRVGLFVPQIRLETTGEARPLLKLFQGAQIIFQSELSVIGDDLCLTTQKKFIPLANTNFDCSGELNLRAEIDYLNNVLFNSAGKLHRDVICFDQSGNERVIKSGIAYCFAPDSQEFYFQDESGVTMENHIGQLYRINLGVVGTVTANGVEICTEEQQTNRPRLYPTIRPVQGIELCEAGKNYHIFRGQFDLRVHIPETDNPLRYQLALDGQRLIPLSGDSRSAFSVKLPETTEELHTLRVIDLIQSVSVVEYSYIVLPDFSWATDRPWYLETENEVRITLSMRGSETTLPAFREGDSTIGLLQGGSGTHSYEFDIPTLSCRIGNWNAFQMAKRIWHEEIKKEDFLNLQLPAGWRAQPMIGTQAIPQNSENGFEIGNDLHSGKRFGATEPLWLSLSTEGRNPEQLLLTEICFEPEFSESPVELTEEGVFWRPMFKFFGSDNPSFKVAISGFADPFTCAMEEKQLLINAELKNGNYRYQVYLRGKGIFASREEKLLYESNFIVGGENYSRFDGYELVLKSAIYWDFQTDELVSREADYGAGILTDLEYIEDSIPSGETLALPHYQATMYLEMYDGRRIVFNSDENSAKYTLINPVSVWIVNDHHMILQNPDSAGLDFDIGPGRIVSKKPELTMTAEMQRKRLKTPDYFGYRMRKKSHV